MLKMKTPSNPGASGIREAIDPKAKTSPPVESLAGKLKRKVLTEPSAQTDITTCFEVQEPEPAQRLDRTRPHNPLEKLKKDFEGQHYRLTRQIGQGGMSTVYEAYYVGDDESFGLKKNTRVAIKVLSDVRLMDENHKKRFSREGKMISDLKHPNIVELYISSEMHGRPYFVLEYLEGFDLGNHIRKPPAPPVPVPAALYIAREVCYALSVVHNAGIIHRDIKPENIFIVHKTSEDEPDRVKVFDLGIAKMVNPEGGEGGKLTRPNTTLGTPIYMAPEMTFGTIIYDYRVDIYALGITLYEMITGKVPFYSPDQLKILMMHQTKAPEPMEKARPGIIVPQAVEELVMRCLAKNPDDRFKDVKAMIRGIESCGLEPKPFSAFDNRSSTLDVMVPKRSFVFPKKLAAAALIAGVIGSAGAYIFKRRAHEAVYTAKFETDVPGASVKLEERLGSGTVVERTLGKTPLEIPLSGTHTVFIEMEGHERAYGKIGPEKRTFTHKIQKRQ